MLVLSVLVQVEYILTVPNLEIRLHVKGKPLVGLRSEAVAIRPEI